MGWTPERTETLRTLWNDGCSAGEMAPARLPSTPRFNFAARAHAVAVKPEKRLDANVRAINIERRAKVADPAFAEPIEPPAPNVCERVTLMDLREHMCRWPLGDPRAADFGFCGARRRAGYGSCCAQHATLAYRPAEQRRPAAPVGEAA